MGAVTILVLTAVVYSGVKTAIHVRPLGKIVVWSESQPTVYADLRYSRRNAKVRVSVSESIPRAAYILHGLFGSSLL